MEERKDITDEKIKILDEKIKERRNETTETIERSM